MAFAGQRVAQTVSKFLHLGLSLEELEREGRLLEAQRLHQRTTFDLEMMAEVVAATGALKLDRDGRPVASDMAPIIAGLREGRHYYDQQCPSRAWTFTGGGLTWNGIEDLTDELVFLFTSLPGLGKNKFQLAGFIPTKGKAGAVITLHPDLRTSQCFRKAGARLQWCWQMRNLQPGNFNFIDAGLQDLPGKDLLVGCHGRNLLKKTE